MTIQDVVASDLDEQPPRLSRFLAMAEAVMPSFLLAVMTVVVLIDVTMRYVLSTPIRGTAELATTAFVWVVFLGSASAARDRLHIRVQLVDSRLGPRARVAMDAVVLSITVIILAALSWIGVEAVAESGSGRNLPMLGLPVGVITIVVPVGLLVTALHYIGDIVVDVRLWRDGDPDVIAAAMDARVGGQQ